jgi:hypothetical protein
MPETRRDCEYKAQILPEWVMSVLPGAEAHRTGGLILIRGLEALQQVEANFPKLRRPLTSEASPALRAAGVAAPRVIAVKS